MTTCCSPTWNSGFSVSPLGVWGNMELTDVNGTSGEFTEIDYSLAYSLGLPTPRAGGRVHPLRLPQ